MVVYRGVGEDDAGEFGDVAAHVHLVLQPGCRRGGVCSLRDRPTSPEVVVVPEKQRDICVQLAS